MVDLSCFVFEETSWYLISSSAASTLSSRTSGVSSGATSSSREATTASRTQTADAEDYIAVPAAVMYTRKYTTLTKPRKPVATGQISRTHSFQTPASYTNGNRFVQSEFSAFKVPALPRFLQKESHPNKFLTSAPVRDAMDPSRQFAFRPLVKHKPGAKLSRHSSYISGQQLPQLSFHRQKQIPAEPPHIGRRNGISPDTEHQRNGQAGSDKSRKALSPENGEHLSSTSEERGRTRNYEPSANDRYWNIITQRVDKTKENRRQSVEIPPYVSRQRRGVSSDGGEQRRHSMCQVKSTFVQHGCTMDLFSIHMGVKAA